jgi:hypothetical protein
VEGTEAFEVFAVFFQHDPFRDHIYDVGSLFDGFYGVGMKTHDQSGQVERLLSYYRDPIGRLNAQGRSANLNFR